MSDDLLYKMTIKVESGAEIDEVEEKLKDRLRSLYDIDTIEAIIVKDQTPPMDEDLEKLLENVEAVRSADIERAIEIVSKMEDNK